MPGFFVPVENTMNLGVVGEEEGDTSRFFPYFMLLSIVCITAYLVFHNKQKVGTDTISRTKGGRSTSCDIFERGEGKIIMSSPPRNAHASVYLLLHTKRVDRCRVCYLFFLYRRKGT